MAKQLEAEQRWLRVFIESERLNVNCVNYNEGVVYAMPVGRGRAKILRDSGIIAQLKRASGGRRKEWQPWRRSPGPGRDRA